MREKIITFRVEEELKNAFEMIAEKQDITASQLLRRFMRDFVSEYMKENKQGSLLDAPKRQANSKAKEKQKSVIPNSWRAK